jgi:hypothetical protein
MIELKGPPRVVRVLSHMMTGCVVWYDFEMRATSKIIKRIPIYNPELDYLVYEGPINIESFPTYHKDYSLNFSIADQSKFNIIPLSKEYRDIVRLARAKCYSLSITNNLTDRAMERNGVVNHPLFDPHINDSDIIEIYQRRLNLDVLSAEKLLKFNKDEHSVNIRNIRNIQIEGELAIVNSSTVEEVISEFLKTCGELGFGVVRPEMITRLL